MFVRLMSFKTKVGTSVPVRYALALSVFLLLVMNFSLHDGSDQYFEIKSASVTVMNHSQSVFTAEEADDRLDVFLGLVPMTQLDLMIVTFTATVFSFIHTSVPKRISHYLLDIPPPSFS